MKKINNKIFYSYILAIIFLPLLAKANDTDFAESSKDVEEAHKSIVIDSFSEDYMEIQEPSYLSLIFDWGFNNFVNSPARLSCNFFPSRVMTIGLRGNVVIAQSHFVASGGVAFSAHTYSIANYVTPNKKKYPVFVRDNDKTELKHSSDIIIVNDRRIGDEIYDSCLDVKYLDFIGELRFNADKYYPKDSFFFAIGAKLGLLLPLTSMSVSYNEDKERKTISISDDLNLKTTRVGLVGRIGWGRFGIYYCHNLTRLFKDPIVGTKEHIRTHDFGISFDAF